MELFDQLQKLAGGGAFGIAVFCALKIYEQRMAARRGERADDRDDRKQEADLVEQYQKMNLAIMAEAQDYRQKYNDCEEECTKLSNEIERLKHENAQLQTVIHGVEWIEKGHITPDALRAAADRQEQGK